MTRTAVVAADCKTTDEMAEMADKVLSMAQQSVSALTAVAVTDTVAALKPRDRSPKRAPQGRGKGRGGGRGGRGGRPQTPARDSGKSGWCRLHTTWGKDAYNCIQPCTYQEN